MHMADALLSPAVGGVMGAASIGALAFAVRQIHKNDLIEEKLPLMAVSGAFVFAAQMVNFSIPGTGSSGHLGGGLLLAGLLGGAPALLTLAAVLVIQCLFFADGGLLALGANIFNMGVLPCLVVYPFLFRPFLRKGLSAKRLSLAAVLSAVVGLQLGAFGVVLETLASGVTELPFSTFVALMQPIHLAIGIVEGLVTAAILVYVYRIRPELLQNVVEQKVLTKGTGLKRLVVTFGVLALLVGGGLSLLASSHPDGLEWSMERTAGTADLVREDEAHQTAAAWQESTAVLPDYDFAEGTGSGTSVSGILGAVLTCALAGGAGGVITWYKHRKKYAPK